MKPRSPTKTFSKSDLKNLYSRVGGEESIRNILEDFYGRMSEDTMIGFFFAGKDLRLIAAKQRQFLMRAMGASPVYSGKSPAQAHRALPPILKGHFDRRLRILEATLRDHGLRDEDIRIWLAFENSFRNAVEA